MTSASALLRQIDATIRKHRLIVSGQRIAVGVSGGADSMLLLHALWFLQQHHRFTLVAAHLDHGLRGRASRNDALLVEQVCARLGVPLCREALPPGSLKTRIGISLEMAARNARLAFFQNVMTTHGCHAIAVAHHQGDQAETVLMRLLSGSGSDGLAGIRYRSSPRPGLTVIRPMLDLAADRVRPFLRKFHIPWREDRSNADPGITRNRYRHILLPMLKQHGHPAAIASLARMANILHDEQEILAAHTRTWYRRCHRAGGLNRETFGRAPVATQRRILRTWLAESGIPERRIDHATVELLRTSVLDQAQGTITLPGNRQVKWQSGLVQITLPHPAKPSPRDPPVALACPGETAFGNDDPFIITVEPATGFDTPVSQPGQFPASACIKRDESVPLTARTRRAGDRFRPTGMNGDVTLKKLFSEWRLPAGLRQHLPLIAGGGQLIWVPGHRIAETWKVANPQAPSWRITIRRKGQVKQ